MERRAAELRRFVSDTLAAASREILAAVDRLLAELEPEAAGCGRPRQLDVRPAGAKCKRSSSPAGNPENPENLDSASRPRPLRCRSGRRTGRLDQEENHIQLRIRVLDDPGTAVLSGSVLRRCPVRELRFRPGLQEADFALLLRRSFPQLSDFDLLAADRRRRLWPLRAPRLTPEEIRRRCSTLHIRPRGVRAAAPRNRSLRRKEPPGRNLEPPGRNPEPEETCRPISGSVPGDSAGTGMDQSDGELQEPEDSGEDRRPERRTPRSIGHVEPAETAGTVTPSGPQEGAPVGPESSAGLVGPEGSAGLVGPEGSAGLVGPESSAGLVGPEGSAGLVGPEGSAGLVGPEGSAGPAGIGRANLDSSTGEVCGSSGPEEVLVRPAEVFHAEGSSGEDGSRSSERCGEPPAAGKGRGEPEAAAERHRCSTCQQEFRLREQLQRHRSSHRGGKPRLCGVCGKALSDQRSLSRHMMIHSEERPHGCPLCGKRFKLAGTLRQHQKIHTERRRSFLCHVCCKMFLTGQQLHDHLMTHGERRAHRCAQCGKAFVKKGALTVHMRVHTGETPYRCPHCGWRFRWKNNLVEHLRVHSGAKPYVCAVCGKACARKVYLTVHMRTHSGERPYRCALCHKLFTQSHCLKTHMRSHQGAEPAPPQHHQGAEPVPPGHHQGAEPVPP